MGCDEDKRKSEFDEQLNNLHSPAKGQAAIIALTRATVYRIGNLPPLPAIFRITLAPVVRTNRVRELAMLRWDMPVPTRSLPLGRTAQLFFLNDALIFAVTSAVMMQLTTTWSAPRELPLTWLAAISPPAMAAPTSAAYPYC